MIKRAVVERYVDLDSNSSHEITSFEVVAQYDKFIDSDAYAVQMNNITAGFQNYIIYHYNHPVYLDSSLNCWIEPNRRGL